MIDYSITSIELTRVYLYLTINSDDIYTVNARLLNTAQTRTIAANTSAGGYVSLVDNRSADQFSNTRSLGPITFPWFASDITAAEMVAPVLEIAIQFSANMGDDLSVAQIFTETSTYISVTYQADDLTFTGGRLRELNKEVWHPKRGTKVNTGVLRDTGTTNNITTASASENYLFMAQSRAGDTNSTGTQCRMITVDLSNNSVVMNRNGAHLNSVINALPGVNGSYDSVDGEAFTPSKSFWRNGELWVTDYKGPPSAPEFTKTALLRISPTTGDYVAGTARVGAWGTSSWRGGTIAPYFDAASGEFFGYKRSSTGYGFIPQFINVDTGVVTYTGVVYDYGAASPYYPTIRIAYHNGYTLRAASYLTGTTYSYYPLYIEIVSGVSTTFNVGVKQEVPLDGFFTDKNDTVTGAVSCGFTIDSIRWDDSENGWVIIAHPHTYNKAIAIIVVTIADALAGQLTSIEYIRNSAYPLSTRDTIDYYMSNVNTHAMPATMTSSELICQSSRVCSYVDDDGIRKLHQMLSTDIGTLALSDYTTNTNYTVVYNDTGTKGYMFQHQANGATVPFEFAQVLKHVPSGDMETLSYSGGKWFKANTNAGYGDNYSAYSSGSLVVYETRQLSGSNTNYSAESYKSGVYTKPFYYYEPFIEETVSGIPAGFVGQYIPETYAISGNIIRSAGRTGSYTVSVFDIDASAYYNLTATEIFTYTPTLVKGTGIAAFYLAVCLSSSGRYLGISYVDTDGTSSDLYGGVYDLQAGAWHKAMGVLHAGCANDPYCAMWIGNNGVFATAFHVYQSIMGSSYTHGAVVTSTVAGAITSTDVFLDRELSDTYVGANYLYTRSDAKRTGGLTSIHSDTPYVGAVAARIQLGGANNVRWVWISTVAEDVWNISFGSAVQLSMNQTLGVLQTTTHAQGFIMGMDGTYTTKGTYFDMDAIAYGGGVATNITQKQSGSWAPMYSSGGNVYALRGTGNAGVYRVWPSSWTSPPVSSLQGYYSRVVPPKVIPHLTNAPNNTEDGGQWYRFAGEMTPGVITWGVIDPTNGKLYRWNWEVGSSDPSIVDSIITGSATGVGGYTSSGTMAKIYPTPELPYVSHNFRYRYETVAGTLTSQKNFIDFSYQQLLGSDQEFYIEDRYQILVGAQFRDFFDDQYAIDTATPYPSKLDFAYAVDTYADVSPYVDAKYVQKSFKRTLGAPSSVYVSMFMPIELSANVGVSVPNPVIGFTDVPIRKALTSYTKVSYPIHGPARAHSAILTPVTDTEYVQSFISTQIPMNVSGSTELVSVSRGILNAHMDVAATNTGTVSSSIFIDSEVLGVEQVSSAHTLDIPMYDESALLVASTPVTMTYGGTEFEAIGFSMDLSEGDAYWTAQISISSRNMKAKPSFNDAVAIHIGSDEFHYLVDSTRTSARMQDGFVLDLELVGTQAAKESPRALRVTQSWEEVTQAKDIVESLIGTVSWGIVDWSIPASRVAIENGDPMALAEDIVGAAGGVLEPIGTGISVRYLHPTVATNMENSVDFTIYSSFIAIKENAELQTFANRYRIRDEDGAEYSDLLEYIEDEELGTKTLYGYAAPIGPAWIETTSDLSIFYLGEEDVEHTEVVEFVEGEGQVAKPLLDIVSVRWVSTTTEALYFEKGSTTITSTGSETFYGLAEIVYTARALKYDVRTEDDVDVAQFLIVRES